MRLQSLWGAAQRGKFRGIANSDVLSTFISPHCGQPPVPRSLAGNPLAFHDTLNVAGIGEEADGVVNGKWGLWCDCPHHHIGSRGTVAAKPSIIRVFVRHKGLTPEDGGFVMVEKISHGLLPSNGATPNRVRPPFTRPTPMVSRAVTFPRRVDNRLMGAGFVFDRLPECARSGPAAYTSRTPSVSRKRSLRIPSSKSARH